MKLQTSFDLQFWVHTNASKLEYAAGIGMEDVKLGFQALTKDMNLTFQLEELNVEKVNILQCSFGKLSAFSLKLAINNGFRVAKPFLNGILEKNQIQLPKQVFNLFKLEALTLGYYDNYVYAGVTPVFIPQNSTMTFSQPEVHEPRAIWIANDGTQYTFEEVAALPEVDELVQF